MVEIFRRGIPSGRTATHQRAVTLAPLFLCVLAATTICVRQSLSRIGEPFNGFLVERSGTVVPFAEPTWTGAHAALPPWGKVTAINGKPVRHARQIFGAARDAGTGNVLAYTFATGGKAITRKVPVMDFGMADYVAVFGMHLLNGLAFFALGFGVAMTRPDLAAGPAMLLFCLTAGLRLILPLADFGTYDYASLTALAEAIIPSGLLYLALSFPELRGRMRRREVLLALAATTAAIALINVAVQRRAPARVAYYHPVFLAWAITAAGGAVFLLWRRYRSTSGTVETEKIKLVFLAAVIALGVPAAILVGARIISAHISPDVALAGAWLLPAALTYAIVKRDPFEIDLLLRRAATYLGLSSSIFALYIGVVATLGHLFPSADPITSPWFTLLFSLAILTVIRPLRDTLQAGIDRVLFHTRFDYAQITESLSRALARTLDMREIGRSTRRILQETMAPAHCHLLVSGSEPGSFRSVEDAGIEVRFDRDPQLALAEGRILFGPTIAPSDGELPPGTALVVPLCFEKQLDGVLLLGPKKSGGVFGPRDLDLLRTLANQTATALRNAASYRRVTELLTSLETRVEERTRELQKAQVELQASNERMQQLDRMKTQFFSDASHELRTPLTLVLGPLAELRRQADHLDAPTRRLVDLAHSNASKLLVLSDTLLDLARLDAGRMQPSCRSKPLGPLIQRTAEPFRWLAEQRGLTFVLRNLHEPYTAWCDGSMVGKIVGNLLANALKFTTAGGIEVEIAYRTGRVSIRVSDTGPGIPAGELPYIFERYRQASTAARSPVSGSGLGLALVRELTELQNGTVEVESTVGRGTTFLVWLPAFSPIGIEFLDTASPVEIPRVNLAALAAAGAQPAAAPVPPEPPPGNHPLILAVDDNPALLEFVQNLLANEYRVQSVASAEKALAFLQDQRPDLILSDVTMAGQDGVAFCQNVKRNESLRHIPLILLTARAGLESKLSGLEAGADDYITKPFHPQELKARMRALLRMRQMESELGRSHADLEKAYRELQDAQAQLIQAEKMASLGTLVAGVAHEINNPVSFVNSSIDLILNSITEMRRVLDSRLETDGAEDSPLAALRRDLDYEYRMNMLQQNAEICLEGASRAARIVKDLRTFCRPSFGPREPADLHESIDQSLRLLHGESKGRIKIRREYGTLPRVLCDAGQMGQVFMNLLANAIHAIDGTGTVTIRTRGDDGMARIAIEDTGCGIDEKVLPRIFDPFFTTKEVGKGTGLGLSIVRSLIAAHGGTIGVQSTAGRGATFTVSIPINGESNG